MTSIQSILMVRPSGFKTNIQTLKNNFFQNFSNLNENKLLEKAQQEFDNLVNKIRSNGIPVIVFQDDQKHETPDSLFPNNWISFHKKNNTTILISKLFTQIDEMATSVIFGFFEFINSTFLVIVFLLILSFADWKITISAMLFLSIFGMSIKLLLFLYQNESFDHLVGFTNIGSL